MRFDYDAYRQEPSKIWTPALGWTVIGILEVGFVLWLIVL